MKITVAICTWNRAALLEQTLAAMRQLSIPSGVDWELLVVNNRCTDHTDEVLAHYQQYLPIRRLYEPEQGTSRARNCAIRAATGELMLWTDDDVLVAPDWFAEYVQAARDWPKAAFFGGTVDPWFAKVPPRWIQRHLDSLEKLRGVFVIRQLGANVRPLKAQECPFGANMAIRTEIQRHYPYDVRLGPVKDAVLKAEELELFERLQADGYSGVWVGSARVRHYVAAERLTQRYVWEWCRGLGQTELRREGLPESGRWWGVPRWMLTRYVLFRAKSLAWRCLPGQRWVPAFLDAACYRGMIEEVRRRRVRQHRPEAPASAAVVCPGSGCGERGSDAAVIRE